MTRIHCNMYCCGQGSFNLIWIGTDRNHVDYAAIVDSGSTTDKRNHCESSLKDANYILDHAKMCDVFITHLDADHYNLT